MTTLAIVQNLQWQELVIIFFIILLLFGAKRLPEIARSMGKAAREFKSATKDVADDVRSGFEDDEKPPSEATPSGERKEE